MDHLFIGNTRQTKTMVTLGNPENPVTCSMAVGIDYFKYYNLIGAHSFDDAIFTLGRGDADYLLVPGAYKGISELLMRDDLNVVTTFAAKIPALVLTAGGNLNVDERNVLYYQPATTSLINNIKGYNFIETKPVASNQAAVEELLDFAQPDLAAAITNELVAERYGLDIVQVLREPKNMSFIVFEAIKLSGRA